MKLLRRTFLAAPFALVARAQTVADDFPRVRRVVAVGDIHGDKDALAAVLRMAALIDGDEKWIGGRAHLVQIGDVPARGPQTREAFDLLMRLEKEAAAAGGRVHALIGNHEVGVMSGDLRNILPEEYEEFRRPDSEERVKLVFEQELDSLKRAGRLPPEEELEEFKTSWFERHAPGFVEHREAFRPDGFYGSWIRRNNSVIRVNDTLFLHGGISPKYVARTRTSLNQAIRRELADPDHRLPGVSTDTQGPLWYRGFAEGDDPGPIEAHLKRVLAFHGVQRIVIAHTVTRSAILPRFGGRVVNIDIGLSRFYGRPPACLVLEPPAAFVLHNGTKIPLPGPKAGELVRYLEAVEAADTQPSPVTKLLMDKP